MRSSMICGFLAGALLACAIATGLGATSLAATPLPVVPCGGASPVPAPTGEKPAILMLDDADELGAWQAPACLGWHARTGDTLLALAGRIEGRTLEDVAARLVDFSRMTDILYWSTSRAEWRPLFDEVTALSGPEEAQTASDPPPGALVEGATVYSLQNDSDPLGAMVMALEVREHDDTRLVVTWTNRTAGTVLGMTVLPPGALETALVAERSGTGLLLYMVARVGTNVPRWLAPGRDSQINRAVALYRWLAGIPTDREPPAAR
ncbi:MAG: hypothetical protein KDE35_06155 [Geminicoccaceae bacterium]|nr:hypothetical protein [Geminicoccaceae bacterium]